MQPVTPTESGLPHRRLAAALKGRPATLLAALGLAAAPALAANTNLTPRAELSVKETYDSNVYLQDTDPGTPGAFPARKASWITTVTPRVGLDYKPGAAFNLSAFYAPDIVVYHNAHSEDHFAHRVGLSLGGKADALAWEQANAFSYIDGSHLSPYFAAPQDVPAVGGIPLRERRDGLAYRGGLKLTWTVGDFFLRPVGSAYIHDFRTRQQLAATVPAGLIYVNFNDRQDINGGLDMGYKLAEKTALVAGYRYGRQDQFRGPSVFDPTRFADSPYDSEYHRILVGLEGAPAPWLKLAVLGGPDLRTWSDDARRVPGFHSGEILYWIDATVTLLPTKADTVVLLNRRYEQPAFTSQSVYEDITYSITWKHKFSDHWAGSAGFQIYIGDWQAPVPREDWIYTPSVGLTYTHDQHLSAELAYSYDRVDNRVTPVPGDKKTQFANAREFTRHMLSLAAKYTF